MREAAKNPLEVGSADRPRAVADMFGRIAGRYDLMNTLMTGAQDRRWRQLAVEQVRQPVAETGGSIPGWGLDLAAGTGELALALARTGALRGVVAADLSYEMLSQAQSKSVRPAAANQPPALLLPVVGDALRLPFPDDCFACVTVGFGVRNFVDLPAAFAEMHRVVAVGGRLACLELTRSPNSQFNRLFDFYFDRVVPLVGGVVTGDREAYTYLPGSVKRFPPAADLARIMARAGWREVRFRRLGLGTVALHAAVK